MIDDKSFTHQANCRRENLITFSSFGAVCHRFVISFPGRVPLLTHSHISHIYMCDDMSRMSRCAMTTTCTDTERNSALNSIDPSQPSVETHDLLGLRSRQYYCVTRYGHVVCYRYTYIAVHVSNGIATMYNGRIKNSQRYDLNRS